MYNLFSMLAVIYRYKKLYERYCWEIMKKYDLRAADIDILYYVAHSGSENLSKNIVNMGMSKANVSKSVDHLREKELVALSEDREDRRCVHIEITEKAVSLVREIEAIREDMGKRLSRGIAEKDKEAVVRVMRLINENMNEELERLS